MKEQEKKARIAELKRELKELQATPKSDWHTAFEAFLRFKTHKYKGITIRTEVEIGSDAPRTDYVILTEDEKQDFEESIFDIFRKTNVLEYKNPHDSLNRRTLHKIIGYAHLMIGTAEHEGDIPEDQVTISIFRAVKNPGLWKEMEQSGELVKTDAAGIYHVAGITKLPFQIVITSELEGNEYAACRALTDRANEIDVQHVIEDIEKETDDVVREYYRIFLNLVAEKNPEVFEEIRRENNMKYGALMEVMKDEVNEKVNAAVDEEKQEVTVVHIKDIMESFGVTIEKAMASLKIPQTDWDTYAGLVNKKM